LVISYGHFGTIYLSESCAVQERRKKLTYILTYLSTYLHNYLLTYILTYLLTHLLTYLLTPWNKVLLEKLTGLQLVKKLPAFHRTRMFITAFTNALCDHFVTRCALYCEQLLAPHPKPKLEDHPFSAVRDCLFNICAATLHIGGRSSVRNLRTRHSVVTGHNYHRNKLPV